jgi:hypothetical protein
LFAGLDLWWIRRLRTISNPLDKDASLTATIRSSFPREPDRTFRYAVFLGVGDLGLRLGECRSDCPDRLTTSTLY